MKYLRRVFPYYTANPKQPFISKPHKQLPCSWCHLKLCPGPKPDKKEYRKNITRIKNVLQGRRKSIVSALKKEIQIASKKQNYEKAEQLKNTIEALENIFAHQLKPAPTSSTGKKFQNSQASSGSTRGCLAKLLNINTPIKSIEGYDVSNLQGTSPTASMVRFTDFAQISNLDAKSSTPMNIGVSNWGPDKSMYRKFNIQSPASPDDYKMMAEVIKRRFAHKEWSYPDLLLIDGGRGQLNAALRQCQMSPHRQALAGRANVKCQIVSLAKREEELYLPNMKKPIPLAVMPQEIQNLLKHIRDEAHRFAVSHHRKKHSEKFKKIKRLR